MVDEQTKTYIRASSSSTLGIGLAIQPHGGQACPTASYPTSSGQLSVPSWSQEQPDLHEQNIMGTHDTLDAIGAASLLNADAETILLLARRGELPGTKIGKSWVFLRLDVLDFLRAKIRIDTAKRREAIGSPEIPSAVLVAAPGPKRRRALPALPQLATASLAPSPPATTDAAPNRSRANSHNALTGAGRGVQ